MADKTQTDDSGKCSPNPEIENLLFIMDDNSDMLNKILKHVFSLLTESNKTELLNRIATIYNSVSEEKRKTMDRVDIMYHEVSVDKSVFDIPNYSIKVNKDKPKTLKKSSRGRNRICIDKENEFMRKIRSKEPLVIDSVTLNSLERCAVREDIKDPDEPKPPELKMSDETNLDEPKPPELKLSDELKTSDEPKPPELKTGDELKTATTTPSVETMPPGAMPPTTAIPAVETIPPGAMPPTTAIPAVETMPPGGMPTTTAIPAVETIPPSAAIPAAGAPAVGAPAISLPPATDTTTAVASAPAIALPPDVTPPVAPTEAVAPGTGLTMQDNTILNQNNSAPLEFVQKPGIDPNTQLEKPLEIK